MLSPEVWNFKPPKHSFSISSGSNQSSKNLYTEIDGHYFNHNVTVVLPDTVLVPEDLNTVLTKDSVYYKVTNLPVNTFLDKPFIEAFIKSGRLWALSVGTRIDTDDCAAVTPCGHLVLNLLKETYQTLGLEGAQSTFSSERYVIQINLKSDSFIPGKKNYERTVKCLTEFVELKLDFLIAWEPPDDEAKSGGGVICPSSVAAYLSGLGYHVSSCSARVSNSRQYNVRLPADPLSTADHDELLEWMGAVALGVNMNLSDAQSQYLSSYSGPVDYSDAKESQVAVLKFFGFFTTKQIQNLFRIFSNYVERRADLAWAGVHVQGFADSPVSWRLREHTFQTDGDNGYTILLQPDGQYRLFRTIVTPKKMKFKTV